MFTTNTSFVTTMFLRVSRSLKVQRNANSVLVRATSEPRAPCRWWAPALLVSTGSHGDLVLLTALPEALWLSRFRPDTQTPEVQARARLQDDCSQSVDTDTQGVLTNAPTPPISAPRLPSPIFNNLKIQNNHHHLHFSSPLLNISA